MGSGPDELSSQTHAFPCQQNAFPFQSAGKSANFFIGGEHSMTGNENGDRICATSAADSPHRAGSANGLRNLAIALRLSERDLPKRPPYAFLKFCSGRIQRRQVGRRTFIKDGFQSGLGFVMPRP